MTILPSGTVTFLFTDIEGSTKLAREHPETWEIARARHHIILRGAIEANQGYVFQIIGDAFCAAFPTAAEAVKAAIDRRLYEIAASKDSPTSRQPLSQKSLHNHPNFCLTAELVIPLRISQNCAVKTHGGS